MKETLIDMILQFLGKKRDDKASPAPLVEILAKLKDIREEISISEIETEHEARQFIYVKGQSDKALRYYTKEEYYRLGLEGQQLLDSLEKNQIIDEIDRERIIQMVMESDTRSLDMNNLKSTVLHVINEQAPSKLYLEWIKYLFFTTALKAH